MSTDRPHEARAPYLTPATRDEIDSFEAAVRAERAGRVRACVPHPSGVCAAHGLRCEVAEASR